MPDLTRMIREDLRPDAARTRRRARGCVLSMLRGAALAGFVTTVFAFALLRSLGGGETATTQTARVLDVRWRRSVVLERPGLARGQPPRTRRLETSGGIAEPRRWPTARPGAGEGFREKTEIFLVSLRAEDEGRPLLYTTRRYADVAHLRIGQGVTVRLAPGTRLCVESLVAGSTVGAPPGGASRGAARL